MTNYRKTPGNTADKERRAERQGFDRAVFRKYWMYINLHRTSLSSCDLHPFGQSWSFVVVWRYLASFSAQI
jgi:hypothetical protein